MTRVCQNCNQPALPSDTICWHCGQQLTAFVAQPDSTATRASAASPSQLRLGLLYGGLTAVFLIIFLSATTILEKSPLVIFDGRIAYPPNWQSVTAANMAFTLNVPPRWTVAENPAEGDAPYFSTTLQSFNATPAQADLRLIATSPNTEDDATPFVMVAYMPQLTAFSAAELLDYVRNNEAINYATGDIVRGLHPDPAPAYIFEVQDGDQRLRCLQQVTRAYEQSYLVSGCAPLASYPDNEEALGHALATFQILEPSN